MAKSFFIDGQGSQNVALLGDNLAKIAINNNWGGIIINGFVRDVQILRSSPSYIRTWCLPKEKPKESAR